MGCDRHGGDGGGRGVLVLPRRGPTGVIGGRACPEVPQEPPLKTASSAGAGSVAVPVFATRTTAMISDDNAEKTPNHPSTRRVRRPVDPTLAKLRHNITLRPRRATTTTAATTASTAWYRAKLLTMASRAGGV